MDSDPNRPIERPAPADYASVKYAVAVLLVAGALVAAAVTGVFNGPTGDVATTDQPAPAATADAGAASNSGDAAKTPEATPPAGDAPRTPEAAPGANTGTSSGEAGSDTPPPAQPAPGATQPEATPPAATDEPSAGKAPSTRP